MATSKQITELIAATGVNSTDQLPLAQSGNSEAVRATVQQLAEAVGELNETGALRELELATSLGKNLLAQNLTEKGVPTTPDETLISMANKVNNLQTTESTRYIVSGLSTTSAQYSYDTAGSGYGKVTSVCLLHGYTALVSNGIMYFCNTTDDYSTFDDFINKAHSSIDLGFTDTSAILKPSPNGEYIAVLQAKEYNVVDIYHVDYENKTFSFTKSVTLPSTYSTYYGVGINNDASLIAWVNNRSSSARAYLMLVEDSNTAIQVGNLTNHTDQTQLTFDTENQSLYISAGYTTTGSYQKYVRVDYTINEGSLSSSTVYNYGYPAGMGYAHKFCPYTNQCLVKSNNYGTTNYASVYVSVAIIDLRTGYTTVTCNIEPKVNWTESYGSSVNAYEMEVGGLMDCPVEIYEDCIKYHMCVPDGYLVYEKKDASLHFDYTEVFQVPKPTDFFARTQGSSPYYFYKTSAEFFDSKKTHVFISGEWNMNYFKIIDIAPQQVVGTRRVNNGYTTEYYCLSYPADDIKNERYSIAQNTFVLDEESN